MLPKSLLVVEASAGDMGAHLGWELVSRVGWTGRGGSSCGLARDAGTEAMQVWFGGFHLFIGLLNSQTY